MDVAAAAGGVIEEHDWPVCGMVGTVSADRRRLVLNRKSPNYHDGMYLVFAPYDPEGNYDDVPNACVERVEDNVVHLEAALDGDVAAGARFFTLPRATPDDLSDFGRMDCINVVQGMHEELRSEECIGSRERRLAVLGIVDDDGSAESMERAWTACQRNMAIIEEKCVEFRVVGAESFLAQKFTKLLAEIRTIQSRIFEAEWAERGYQVAVRNGAECEKFYSLWSFDKKADDAEKKSEYTELVEYFLRVAMRKNLRHKGKVVMKQVMTTVDKWKPLADNPRCESCDDFACFAPLRTMDRARCPRHRTPADLDCRLVAEDETRPGLLRMQEDERTEFLVPTRAWRPMMIHDQPVDIRTWMHLNVDQHSQPALWNKFFLFYGQGVSTCDRYMCTADHPFFRQYQPDPKMFSFQNGVYDIRNNRFYQYMLDHVPDVCCVNHIEAYFDPVWTEVDLDELAVPGYDDIVASQDYDVQMRSWLDVFLGRLFFSVGELDNWEKFLVVKGWAATGKSTIAKAIVALFGASNVGTIPANCEAQWALASVHDKLVWLCTELKKDWRFPTAVLQSMISGEGVSVHVKNQTAVDVSWRIPGAAFGNEEPTAWINDPMNALHRRVIPMPFDKSPKSQDPTIQKRFMANVARFLVRIVRRYVFTVTYVVKEGCVDDFLPRRLKEARTDFLHQTQPAIKFLEETEDLILAPEDLRKYIQPPDATGGRRGGTAATPALGSMVTPMPDAHTVADIKREWRVPMTEVNSKFRDWWVQNNLGKNPPSIMSKSVYDIVIRHLGVSVERDEDDRKDYMYGVKAVTAIRNNGHQAIAFNYGGAVSAA